MTSSSTQTTRRVFYWISLAILILTAAQTVLDALDVRHLPRRSWSEGINPKVIQVPGSTLYFEYISVKKEDIRISLPDGVQPFFLGLAAVVNPKNAAAKGLLRIMTIPEDLFFLALVWLLRSMVLSAWSNPGGDVTPFVRANVNRLRWIAVLFGAMWVYHLVLPTFIDEVSFYSALNDFGPVIGEDLPWFLTNGTLGVAVLLLILSQVFSYGARLQKDVEGLV